MSGLKGESGLSQAVIRLVLVIELRTLFQGSLVAYCRRSIGRAVSSPSISIVSSQCRHILSSAIRGTDIALIKRHTTTDKHNPQQRQ